MLLLFEKILFEKKQFEDLLNFREGTRNKIKKFRCGTRRDKEACRDES